MNDKKKRLIVEIPLEFHKWIKRVSNEKDQTITWWVIEALEEKQIKDMELGF